MLEPEKKCSRVLEDTRESDSLHTRSVTKMPETARGLFLSVLLTLLGVEPKAEYVTTTPLFTPLYFVASASHSSTSTFKRA